MNGDGILDALISSDVGELWTRLGEAGDDTLDGGVGSDFLVGGGGSDTFYFETGDGNDTISDFEIGVDLIDLSRTNATSMVDLTFQQIDDDAQIDVDGLQIQVLDVVVVDLENAGNFAFV